MSKEQERERAVIEAVKALPDAVEMILYQRSLHPYNEPITTDDLKLLAAGAERAGALEAALRHYANRNNCDSHVAKAALKENE